MNYRYLDKNEKYKIKDIYLNTFDDPDVYVNFYTDEYSKNTDTFVCENNEEIVAMANVHYKEICAFNINKKSAYIYGVATKESYRNKGIMTNILKKIIEDLGDKNIELIYLVPAISPSVYEKLGFRLIRKEKKYIIYNEKLMSDNKTLVDDNMEYDDMHTYEIYRTYENSNQMIKHMKEILKIKDIKRIIYKINPIMIYEPELLIQSVDEYDDMENEDNIHALDINEFENKFTLEQIYNGFMYNDEV